LPCPKSPSPVAESVSVLEHSKTPFERHRPAWLTSGLLEPPVCRESLMMVHSWNAEAASRWSTSLAACAITSRTPCPYRLQPWPVLDGMTAWLFCLGMGDNGLDRSILLLAGWKAGAAGRLAGWPEPMKPAPTASPHSVCSSPEPQAGSRTRFLAARFPQARGAIAYAKTRNAPTTPHHTPPPQSRSFGVAARWIASTHPYRSRTNFFGEMPPLHWPAAGLLRNSLQEASYQGGCHCPITSGREGVSIEHRPAAARRCLCGMRAIAELTTAYDGAEVICLFCSSEQRPSGLSAREQKSSLQLPRSVGADA
jgi:hypothetical protein